MKKNKSGSELRNLAKIKLERNYGISILALLVVMFSQYIVSTSVMQALPTDNLLQFIIYLFVTFFISAFLGIFQTGTNLFFLNMACGQPYKLDQLFYGFQHNPGSSLVVSLVTGMVSLISSLPFRILFRCYYESKNPTYILWAFVSLVIGFIIQYPISLALSQSFYLLLDFPDYTGKQALLASCKIMKKHMLRLFGLQLSFLPLMLLCVFTYFIGFLWLMPYMNMTYTLFFLDIMQNRE